MNAPTASGPSVRWPTGSEQRRSTLRLLVLQLIIPLLGAILLTSGLLA